MVKSAYDIINLVESELEDDDIDMVNDISDAGVIVAEIDEDLDEIYDMLGIVHDKFLDNELTLADVNEFFETDLRNIAEVLKGIRERLY